MLYYILGILAVIVVHLITFLKCYENGIKVNWLHMCMSAGFSCYMVYIVEYLHNNVIENGIGLAKLTVMFIPAGIFMPIIYKRFKYFLMNILYVLCVGGLISILQYINCNKFNPLNNVFELFGVLIGFIFTMIINEISPEFRKKCIIKKRNKQIRYLSFEAETLALLVFVLFFAGAIVERISGRDIEKQKGAVVYEHEDEYKDIYYADKDKYDRYDAYAKLHPDMKLEDVVWRVDANLDQKFYDEAYTTKADANTKSPLLINKFNRVSEDYKPEELVSIEGDYVATPETTKAYHELINALEDLGMKIYVVSSYRSVEYQKNLHDYYLKSDTPEEVDTYSSRAGYSEHHTGRALDISQVRGNLDAFEGSDEAVWVYENAYKYGFIVRYMDNEIDVTGYIFEPWHITYVGKEIAQTMHDEKITTLEEYVVKYVDHKKP